MEGNGLDVEGGRVPGGCLPPCLRQLEIARDPAFTMIIKQTTVAGNSVAVPLPAPGLYFWHLRAVTGGSLSVPSAVQRLEIRP